MRQHASLEGFLTLDKNEMKLTGPSRLGAVAPSASGRRDALRRQIRDHCV